MPYLAPHPCGHPGCPALVRDGGYCAAHTKVSAERRTKVSDPFYRSTAWRNLRTVVLRAHPLCQGSGCHAVATLVDHIVPIDRGGAKLEIENLQALCSSCHARRPEHGWNAKAKEAA